jgi:TetR/AcrR family transcriptional regulator
VGTSFTTANVTTGHPTRADAKRERILEAATRLFAERGYGASRAEDVAAAAGIAKGSVFQHFGSKEGLFLEVYKRAMESFSAYLAAPEEVLAQGFFATLRYWLERTEGALREDWVPCRIALLGNYGADLGLRREINRFMKAKDPYGTAAFVRWGRKRKEVREDVDEDMIVSILDWTVDRFQDALLVEELDPGLFRRPGPQARPAARIEQFLELLRSAIGAERARKTAPRRRGPRR